MQARFSEVRVKIKLVRITEVFRKIKVGNLIIK